MKNAWVVRWNIAKSYPSAIAEPISPKCARVEYARIFLMSVCPNAQRPAQNAISEQSTRTTSRTSGVRKPNEQSLTIINTPAATIVAAWISAETGVGPAIASGNQTCSGNCALLPRKPQSSNSPIAVEALSGLAAMIFASSEKSVVPNVLQQNIIPSRKPKSPTRFTINAFLDASLAASVEL